MCYFNAYFLNHPSTVHFILQQHYELELCAQCGEVKVAQSCPTLCDPKDYAVHVTLQARILEWVAVPFSRGSSQPRN